MSNKSNEPKIMVVGSSNMDLITYISRFPIKGETLTGYKFQTVGSHVYARALWI